MQSIVLRMVKGLLLELNPGPLAPEARIIPLDQAAGDVCAIYETCHEDVQILTSLNRCACRIGRVPQYDNWGSSSA